MKVPKELERAVAALMNIHMGQGDEGDLIEISLAINNVPEQFGGIVRVGQGLDSELHLLRKRLGHRNMRDEDQARIDDLEAHIWAAEKKGKA